MRLEKTEIVLFCFLNCLPCALVSVFLGRSDRLTTAGPVTVDMKNHVDIFLLMPDKKVFYKLRKKKAQVLTK